MAMPSITFKLQMFRGDWDQVWSQMRLLWLMEGLCRVNQTHLRQFDEFKSRGLVEKSYPALYRSGMHYETEKGTEIWPDIPSMLAGVMGAGNYPGPWSDCEDLACYRVAEYREMPWHYERPAKTLANRVPGSASKVEIGDPLFPPGPAEQAAHQAGKGWPSPWKKVKGGTPAKPYAKWRRGPTGSYHYHALCLTADGRLEDPSLVLGMGREGEFHDAGMAKKLMDGAPVVIQYAKPPDVMIVDPEKPSGYGGGDAVAMDEKVMMLVKKGVPSESLGDAEMGAYIGNELLLGEGEVDVDAIIGWNRIEKCFAPRSDGGELRRLRGYAKR